MRTVISLLEYLHSATFSTNINHSGKLKFPLWELQSSHLKVLPWRARLHPVFCSFVFHMDSNTWKGLSQYDDSLSFPCCTTFLCRWNLVSRNGWLLPGPSRSLWLYVSAFLRKETLLSIGHNHDRIQWNHIQNVVSDQHLQSCHT